MGKVIMLSGPVGAGKTAVARELLPLLDGQVSYIEGDRFWSFIAKTTDRDRRQAFQVILRSMTAAAVPFARSGYDVLLDFSIPSDFLATARKILKEVPIDYVVLRPSETICAARAAARTEGRIADYTRYRDFYRVFEGMERHRLAEADTEAASRAARIREGLNHGRFRLAESR